MAKSAKRKKQSSSKGKPREPNRCIMCNGTGMTKEHTIPDWVKGVVKIPVHGYHQSIGDTTVIDTDKNNMVKTFERITNYSPKPGHIGSLNKRNLCNDCNSKWGKALEDIAKPILAPLMNMEKTTITLNEMKIIAQWAYWVSIKVEYTQIVDISTVYTPFSDRANFRKDLTIPDYCEIYIAFTTDINWRYKRIQRKRPVFRPSEQHLYMNETVCIGLGNLFLMVYKSQLKLDFRILEKFGAHLKLIYKDGKLNFRKSWLDRVFSRAKNENLTIPQIPTGITDKIDEFFHERFPQTGHFSRGQLIVSGDKILNP